MRHIAKTTCILIVAALLAASPALAGDWPAFRHDYHRSGATAEKIDAKNLQPAWAWRSAVPPQTAWHGPAKWDAYHAKKPLSEMRNYDPVFHPTVVGNRLYFGSSADDAVHCVDTKTGKEVWRFTTGGPVRIAPTWHEGKLYFGSDDGVAYCIKADTGKLEWSYSPTAGRRLVLNNGRMISFWPIRTGVTIAGGTAYFAASMLPWKESYLCGLDAETGATKGKGRFVKRFKDLTFEGAFAATDNYLLTPQGRLWLLVFDRRDGRRRQDVRAGGAGSFVMVTDDGHVMGGSGSRGLAVGVTNVKNPKEKAFSHGGAKMATVQGKMAYLITDNDVYAVDRATRKRTWGAKPGPTFSVIVAGGTVFVGSRDKVLAYNGTDGVLVWQAAVAGDVHGMAVANGALFASTHEGVIHCFRPDAAKAAWVGGDDQNLPLSEFAVKTAAKPVPVKLAAGPYLQFTGVTTAVVRWRTQKLSPTILVYGNGSRRFEDKTPKVEHTALIDGLRPRRTYDYEIHTLIDGKAGVAQKRNIETFFNYTLPPVPAKPNPYPVIRGRDPHAMTAKQTLAVAKTDQGMCLVLGVGGGRLAYELAKQSKFRVLCVETDETKVAAARATLQKTNVYGSRIAVLKVDSYSDLPLPPYFANLVVSADVLENGKCASTAAEVSRVLRPSGGVAYVGQPQLARAKLATWLKGTPLKYKIRSHGRGSWATISRDAPLPGSGEWSHQYGRSDNATTSGDALMGAKKTSDMEALWIGRPGPRYQADRQVRKPAPLAINGRLFIQGLERLIAADSFNGEILWSLEVPGLMRFNMPRDASNYCADDDYVYLLAENECWQIDAATGTVERMHDVVPAPGKTWPLAWGYVASDKNAIIGTSTKQGSTFTGFWGSGSWFDGSGGVSTAKVCSDNLFAIDKTSGSTKWTYSEGVIIHTTIAIGGGRIYFVESRNKKMKDLDKRLIWEGELWKDQVMVALDVETGRKVWEMAIEPAAGTVMFSLSYSGERLVLLSSGGGRYSLYTFDAPDGKATWKSVFGWSGGNHGAHMARPIILGNKVYVTPAGFDLTTGKKMKDGIPGGRCGTVSAGKDSFFFRGGGSVAMWSPSTKDWTSWGRLRPDCWLSTIPANGMVLSPEGGGGCWCSVWLETSAGFVRPQYPRPEFAKPERTFIGSMKVELVNKAKGGAIRYTLDGTMPTKDSALYGDAIALTGQTTINAKTFWSQPGSDEPASGILLSDTFERLYPAPEFTPLLRLFSDTRTVQIAKKDPEGQIRYTLDGTAPTKASPRYTRPLKLTKTTTITTRIFYANGKESDVGKITYTKVTPILLDGVAYIPGIRFRYYECWGDKVPKFADLKPVKSGAGGNFSIAPRVKNDGFAMQFAGFINIPKDGKYTFLLQSDDGSTLHIGGKKVVDNDGMHDARGIKSGSVELKAGLHPIEVGFFECVGGELLKVMIEGPGLGRKPIPDTMLYMKDE